MRIAVIGAGMAGVAAAQALAAEGHQVAVFERRASVAEETSFAPAGIAAAGLAAPWLAPGARFRAPWSRAEGDPRLRELGTAFAAEGRHGGADAARHAQRAQALLRLLAAGIERIDALAHALALDFERGRGLLLTLADPAAQAQARVAVDWLAQAGEPAEWTDAERQRALEPGRAPAPDPAPAIHLPGALVGNTREWTQLLRGHAQGLGVKFMFGHEVASIAAGPRPALRYTAVTGARAGDGDPEASRAPRRMFEVEFDAIVVCAALDAARLLAPLGLKLAWRPIRGTSITVPLHLREAAPDIGPRAALLDVRTGIAITRLGTRVRVAGGCEPVTAAAAAAGIQETPSAKALQPLYEALDAGFPGAVQWPQAQAWTAARPALADGLPAVGASGVAGIWLDVGHAHHGWPLSQVAAEALCAMIAGRPPRVDVGVLAPQRLR